MEELMPMKPAEGMNSHSQHKCPGRFCTTAKPKEFMSVWRTLWLSLRAICGTEKRNQSSGWAFFLLPLPFPACAFLCSWGLSAEVPGTVCTMISLKRLALLPYSLTTKPKLNQTRLWGISSMSGKANRAVEDEYVDYALHEWEVI